MSSSRTASRQSSSPPPPAAPVSCSSSSGSDHESSSSSSPPTVAVAVSTTSPTTTTTSVLPKVRRWEQTMRKARKLHRPNLRDWAAEGLEEIFPTFVQRLAQQPNYQAFCPLHDDGTSGMKVLNWIDLLPRKLPLDSPAVHHIPAVLDAKTLSPEDFWKFYEGRDIPCVIRDIPLGYDGARVSDPWPAVRRWSLDILAQDPDVKRRRFKCGEDDDGRSIRVKLTHFLKYLRHNRDDSPLYVFDTSFDEDARAKRLLQDYRVPTYFRQDLFGLISEARRPPYRWILIGPERSGTCVHIDPLATNAWNTLLRGRKRWVLFPPHVPKHVVKGRGLIRDDEDDEAIHYFMYILPRIKRRAASLRYHPDYDRFACFEFTQFPGETVFVPNGWWHAVLNITDSVGVTQNYCSPRNFDRVWRQTRQGRQRMAWKWLLQLDQKVPVLGARARYLNERDGWTMKYDPVEIEKRRRRQEEEEQRQRQAQRRLARRRHSEPHGKRLKQQQLRQLRANDAARS